MINHRKWNEVDIHSAEPVAENTAGPHYRGTFPIDQNQSFLGQQSTQIGYHAAITETGHVLVDGRAHLLRQVDEQIGGVADT